MRVLIVDGFASTKAGRQALAEFEGAVRKALEGPYYKFLTDVAIAVRSTKNLHGFVYDMDGSWNGEYMDIASLKAFQSLDAVFMSGDDVAACPWQETLTPVRMLVKMVCTFSTPCFVWGALAAVVPFIVHQKGNNLKVFNGRGRGSDIKELKQMSDKLKRRVPPSDAFLDWGTGDVYKRAKFGEFQKVNNVGLYNPQKRQGSAAPDVYRPKSEAGSIPGTKPYKARSSEELIELSHPRFGQHWILNNLPKRFVVPANQQWSINEKLDTRFQVYLSSMSNHMPQVICLDNTLFAFQFDIREQYPETLGLVQNWAAYVCDWSRKYPTRKMGKVSPDTLQPVQQVSTIEDMWEDKLNEELMRRKALEQKLLQTCDDAPDSMEATTRSAVASRQQQQAESMWRLAGGGGGGERPRAQSKQQHKGASRGIGGPQALDGEFGPDPVSDFEIGVDLDGWKDDFHVETIRKALKTTEITLDEERCFSKVEIRKMLHPEMDVSNITPFVPDKTIRVNGQKRPFSRWKHFSAMDRKLDAELAVSRPATSGTHGTRSRPPSQQPTLRRPYSGASPVPFFTFAGRATTSRGFPRSIPNYVTKTPGMSPNEHTFRTKLNQNDCPSDNPFVPSQNSGGWYQLPIEKAPASWKPQNKNTTASFVR